jgi:cytoskeletal protein CcmA (bactofilin family)
MATLGKTMKLTGELRSAEDITIEGRIQGVVYCEKAAVTLALSAEVNGDVVARDITVFGRAAGRLIATEVVDVRANAHVTGEAVSPRFILNADASFNGRVAPQMLEAALRVARFQQRKREEADDVAPRQPRASA